MQLWNTNGEMGNGLAQEDSNKRQRVETKQLAPHQAIQVKGGVGSLAWLDGQSLVAGCVNDHALKVLDAETAQISATVLTDYKAPLAIDATQGNLIVAGCEDAILRLFDVRANTKVRSINKTYDGHSRAITSVACNP